MSKIVKVRKYLGLYTISIPQKIGEALEKEEISNMVCVLTPENNLLFKSVRVD